MTVVVGIVTDRGVLLGADSMGSDGVDGRIRRDPKLFTLTDEVAVAYCGSFRMGQIIRFHMRGSDLPQIGELDPYEWAVVEFIPMLRAQLQEQGFTLIKNNTESLDGGSEFLLAIRDRLFRVQDDFQVAEAQEPYDACGSGELYALGAIHALYKPTASPKALLKAGMEAACTFCVGCAPPYSFVEVKA